MRIGIPRELKPLEGRVGLIPAAAICEIMNEDGSMARKADLEKFAREKYLMKKDNEEIFLIVREK